MEKSVADQRWWFVTPEGNPFWSLGVTGVRPRSEPLLTDVTRVKGREFLFAALPDRTGPFAAAWQGDYLSFYYWNLLRKYGTIEKWRERLAERLPRWGLNTLGNWSDSTVLAHARMPYTRTLQTNQNPSLNVARNQPDVFDPRWETFVDSLFRRKAAPHREEKRLIGYFVDNEMPWRHLELLRAAPDAPLRRQWVQYLQTRYASAAALNQAWESHFADWAAVAALTPEALPPHEAARRNLAGFEALYADAYFRVVSRTLRKHDPNHLYLGCRFVRLPPAEAIVRAAGRYCDVVTVNVYSLYPEPAAMQQWHDWSGRPLLIGEHHVPLLSERNCRPYTAPLPGLNRKAITRRTSKRLPGCRFRWAATGTSSWTSR